MKKDDLIIEAFDILPAGLKERLPESALDKVGESVSNRTSELQQEIIRLKWEKAQMENRLEKIRKEKECTG